MQTTVGHLPLENISENGVAPEKRIGSAEDAQALVSELVAANRERSRSNAKIKGQLDGNPPYSADRLRQAGQSYRANINFGEAKAALSTALVPYYDLFAGATHYFQVRTDFGSGDDREYFSGIITEEFDRLLKSWHGFDFNIQQMLHDFVVFGKGFLIWGDKNGWRFNCAPQHRVLVPDGTDASSENLEVLAYRERMTVTKLFDFIRNKEAARSIGWNIAAASRAISQAFPENVTGSNQYSYELIQQKLKDKDISEGVRCATIPVAHLYVKEFSGKVSHYMVAEEVGGQRAEGGGQKPDEYLYEGKDCYDNFSQAIAAFFLETLDGSWNGASGLGKDIYATMAIKDRLKCSALDLVFLRTGINMQARTAGAMQKASLVQAGVFNIIPDGFDVQPASILGDARSPIDTDIYLDNVISANTGVYRQRQMRSQNYPITAEQARIDQLNATVLGNSAVNRFYMGLDKLGAETFRRASCLEFAGEDEETKAAKEFQKRCFDRGVPREALKRIECVKASRNMGNGSVYMRQQAIREMLPFYQMLPENGKQNYLEDVVSAIAGHAMVERYAPRKERLKLPNDHQAQAMLENAALKIGAPVTWTPSQNNVIHAQTHLQAAAQAAASLGQGASVTDVVAFIEAVGQHAAVHLQQIAGDATRKDEYQALLAQFKQLASLADKLGDKLKSDQQEQEKKAAAMATQRFVQGQGKSQSNGESSEAAKAKLAQAQLDMQIKQAQAAQELKMKAEKHAQEMALNDARSAAAIRGVRE